MLERLKREPVIAVDMIKNAMLMAVAFGLDLTDAQQTAVLAFVATSTAMAFGTRKLVTPMQGDK